MAAKRHQDFHQPSFGCIARWTTVLEFSKLRQVITFCRIDHLPQIWYQMTLLNETFSTVHNMLGFETKNVHPQVDALSTYTTRGHYELILAYSSQKWDLDRPAWLLNHLYSNIQCIQIIYIYKTKNQKKIWFNCLRDVNVSEYLASSSWKQMIW